MKRYGALIIVLGFGVLLSLHGQAASAGMKPTTVTATPIMGWDGWNEYSHAVTQQTVGNNAWRLVHSGLAADGYKYVIVDAGWAANERSSSGELVANPARYPNGIRALASYVHKLGLKFGIYEPAGVANCDGYMPGGYSGDVSHYQEDAAQFAAWGVDFIKLDWCGMDDSMYDLPQFKGMSRSQVAETLTEEMSAAISDSGRAMVLDVNDGAGITSHGDDWQWGSSAGAGMWRIACDIKPTYTDIVRAIFGDSTECGHSGAAYLGGTLARAKDGTILTCWRSVMDRSRTHWRRFSCRSGPKRLLRLSWATIWRRSAPTPVRLRPQ